MAEKLHHKDYINLTKIKLINIYFYSHRRVDPVGTLQPELQAGEDADVHWFERKDGRKEHLPGTEADQAVPDWTVQTPEVVGELTWKFFLF